MSTSWLCILRILSCIAILTGSGVAQASNEQSPVAGTVSSHDASFIPDFVLRISAQNLAQSCLPEKLTVLVNGTSPGPTLRLKVGKSYWIRVYNDINDQNATMHWHGLAMAASPFSDGTPQVSQWPIPPAHFFDYELSIPPDSAGTYFYHSHVGFQAVSAAGPLIVEDEKPPFQYDDERVIMLTDVFNKTNHDMESGLLANPFVWSGETAMVLVNGEGGGQNGGALCNASLARIDVDPGKTYRLRFIGATALSFVSMMIEGHGNFSIIEADGSYTQPHDTSFLQIGSGQRFSALLTTRSDIPSGTFRLLLETRDRPTVANGYAILNYGSPIEGPIFPPEKLPQALPATDYKFLENTLKPLEPNDFPPSSEVTRRVTISVHQNKHGNITWSMNNYPWTENVIQEPYLVSLYKNDGASFPDFDRAMNNSGIDPVTRAFPARLGEIIDVVFQNTGADQNGDIDFHPFHAHGAHYYDLGAGDGAFDPAALEDSLRAATPVKRDTTMLYRYGSPTGVGAARGWRAWRLRVTQPGVWMVHCHTIPHMIMGMQTVWVFGNATDVLSRVPIANVQGYLDYGGDAYGNSTHWPDVVHAQQKKQHY